MRLVVTLVKSPSVKDGSPKATTPTFETRGKRKTQRKSDKRGSSRTSTREAWNVTRQSKSYVLHITVS